VTGHGAVSGRAAHTVGINLLWLVPGVVGGSEEYATRLLDAVARVDRPDLQIVLFVLEQFPDAHPALAAQFDTVVASSDGANKPRRVLLESTWLPRAAAQRGVALMHHVGGRVPLRTSCPSILTIHDLQPLELPENFSFVKRHFLHRALPRSVARSQLVITPSRYVQRRVVERLHVPEARTAVVPAPVREQSSVLRTRATPEVDALLAGGHPYFVYPAITYTHKNHATLVDAFAQVVAERPDARLVLTGGEGNEEAAVRSRIEQLGITDAVLRTGRIPRGDLDSLIDSATALVFPSFYEGFGVPVLEAMAAGCPVIAADATALPEVVGDAGVLVGPHDVSGWAAAMRDRLDAPRAPLSEAGRARARRFDDSAGATHLLALYDRVLLERSRVG
jgi:glycosyltransferase involved in cell wall biosynthesis